MPALGYYLVKRSSWTKPIGLAASSALAIAASLVGTGFASLLDSYFQTGLAAYSVAAEFVPTVTTDAVNAAVLAPILLYVYAISAARWGSKATAPN